jgi:hypothetical protein
MRLALTAAVGVAMALMLAWEYFNGGVVSHHLLARRDLPSVSNWWGLLVLPALAWYLLGRMERRLADKRSLVLGFVGALLFGAALSTFYVTGHQEWCGHMVLALPLLALFFPIYRAEYVLGFVLGMSFVFGPILPVIAASIFAVVGLVVHEGVRFIARKIRP